MEPEKVYSTKILIEKLGNALENGYEELGETDIGDLLLECEAAQHCVEPTNAVTPLPEELSAEYALPSVECGECGATNRAKNGNCWQCEAEL